MVQQEKINQLAKGTPQIGYVYFNLSDADVRWNLARGVFNTTSEIQKYYPQSTIISFFLKSRIEHGDAILEQELLIEKIRKEKFPHKPSRLTGLFYFSEKKDAENAQKYVKVNHFQNVCLQEIALAPNIKIEKFDMNWISFYNKYKEQYPNDWVERYWNGEICNIKTGLGIPPIWESITEDGFIVPNKEIREECIERFKMDDERLCALLYLSVWGAYYGYILGYAFYCLTKSPNGNCDYLQLGMIVTDEMMANTFKHLEVEDLVSANTIRNLILKYNSLKVPDSTSKGFCITHMTSINNCPNNK